MSSPIADLSKKFSMALNETEVGSEHADITTRMLKSIASDAQHLLSISLFANKTILLNPKLSQKSWKDLSVLLRNGLTRLRCVTVGIASPNIKCVYASLN